MTHADPGAQDGTEALKAEIVDLREQVQYLRARLVGREAWLPFLKRQMRLLQVRVAGSAMSGRLSTRLTRRPPRGQLRPYRVVSRPQEGEHRLRVLHALVHVGMGGSSRIIVDLVEHLPNIEHIVMTGRDPEVDAYDGLKVHQIGHLASERQVQAYLRARRPDLVHVHYVADDPRVPWGEADWRWYHRVFTAAASEGLPVVENVNIPVPPYVSPAIDAYVHVSNYVAQRFGSGEQDVVIYPGSDTDFFTRRPDVPLPDDSIGMVYRLQTDKLDARSVDPLIEAVRKRPGTRAHVIGDGVLMPTFRQAASRAGVADLVEFPGNVPYDALPDWYARLGVFVAPVIRESFGQVVPFAMSMGIPVVGYRVGALPEMIDDEALLAPVGESATLANIIISLLDDRERRLRIGQRNRERALQNYSLPAMIGAYDSLYTGLAIGRRGSP